jgi:hypothetical protein
LIELIEPVVKPVVRPLLMTDMPTAGATVTADGVPMSSIAPVASIWPRRSCAMAASTFWLSGTAVVKSATTVATRQLLSMRPGCVMSSPAAAWSPRASTWLLLRAYCVVPSVMSEPSVPPQQKRLLMSLTLPPETPKLVLRLWWFAPPSARPGEVSSAEQSTANIISAATRNLFRINISAGSPFGEALAARYGPEVNERAGVHVGRAAAAK